ncbi:MAG: tRNA pseudouridine(55) synthase TruB [Magnetococcales bacterium]|nr:tRNA pseudouridine(55) synthase TruB [Magnetococcales bacterium]
MAIYKDPGEGSTRVVEKVKRITQAAKAGHGGTLDPFSEGLLPVALGEGTKTSGLVLDGDKRYRGWVRFGRETDSGDLTGEVIREGDLPADESVIRAALPLFTGRIDQVPPLHSAIRVNGERAYHLARRGEVVEMAPRVVTVHDFTLVSYADGLAEVDVRCSKGTYMRALARDLGRHLGSAAHLERLVRTETLGFQLSEAVRLSELATKVAAGRLDDVLFPVDRVLAGIPALRLRAQAWRKVENGQSIWVEAEGLAGGPVRLMTPEGQFCAYGVLGDKVDLLGRRSVKPRRLFPTERGSDLQSHPNHSRSPSDVDHPGEEASGDS